VSDVCKECGDIIDDPAECSACGDTLDVACGLECSRCGGMFCSQCTNDDVCTVCHEP